MICRAYQCAARLCRAFAPSLRTAPLQSSVRPWSTECICGPLAFRRVAAGELGQRKMRGSQEGDKKPFGVLSPFCPRRRVAARPRTPQRANPGCRAAAFPRLLRQGRRNGGKVRSACRFASGGVRAGGELRRSRKRSHSGVPRPTGVAQIARSSTPPSEGEKTTGTAWGRAG